MELLWFRGSVLGFRGTGSTEPAFLYVDKPKSPCRKYVWLWFHWRAREFSDVHARYAQKESKRRNDSNENSENTYFKFDLDYPWAPWLPKDNLATCFCVALNEKTYNAFQHFRCFGAALHIELFQRITSPSR